MNPIFKKLLPYLLILLGLLFLFVIEQAGAAGVCVLLGVVMIIEGICPEKWEADNRKM